MSKICTSLEQSRKLMELGVDINSADTHYVRQKTDFMGNPVDGKWSEPRYGNTNSKYAHYVVQNFSSYETLPAWSLSALLDLLPPYLFGFERGIDLNIYPNLNGKAWHCSYMPNAVENMKKDKFKQITNGDNLIDAAFEMVCWLKENNKI